MNNNSTKYILIGILICLIFIALKPVPSFNNVEQPTYNSISTTVVPLGENRLAIVDNNYDSGLHGEVFVIEFKKDLKTFDVVGRYNYSDFFSNPQKYKP
ncbi:MAG: hypothetical protein K0S51_1120 [Bacillales bacterium]|jgi:hypothetical protein|nr:hypothetical protein [Bacillales bacterium]